MRLWRLPLSLLSLLVPAAYSAQVTLQADATILSTNIVDALSADPDYTSLLSLLQRAKLIPTLNKLNATTVFAPTNDAIKRQAEHNSIWQVALDSEDESLRDNIQEKLRQELFYHILDFTLAALPDGDEPEVLKTMHFPRKPTEPPTQEPPPSPPWMPRPGGTLGGEPQRLRMATRDAAAWIGVDAFGRGGAEVHKEVVNASNGLLIGIDEVLQVPPDLGASM
jgi:solute carrier family 25 (mitochondrial carnitine/acylcarnitine transporter), member 20/29